MYNPINDEVEIHLSKKAGAKTFSREIKANTLTAAIMGIAILITKIAENTGTTTGHILAVLATVLMAEAEKDEQEEES